MTAPDGAADASAPHVVVTLDSIYMIALETRSDVQDIKTSVTALTNESKDHEARLRALEQAKWKIIGAGTGLGFIAGLIPTILALFALR